MELDTQVIYWEEGKEGQRGPGAPPGGRGDEAGARQRDGEGRANTIAHFQNRGRHHLYKSMLIKEKRTRNGDAQSGQGPRDQGSAGTARGSLSERPPA